MPPRGPETVVTLLYPAAILVATDQIAGVAASLMAMGAPPGSLPWRLVGFGQLAGRSSGLIVADVLLFLGALLLVQRPALRALGSLNLLLAAGLLAGLAIFLRDAALFKDPANARNSGAVTFSVVRATFSTVLAVGLMVWAGVTSLRKWGAGTSKEERDPAPLVVGRPAQPGAGEDAPVLLPVTRHFLRLLAAAGLVIFVDQVLDLASARGALDLGLPVSRVQLLGLIVSRTGEFLTADVLVVCAALGLANRRATRLLGGVHLALGGLAVIVAARFLADLGHLAGTAAGPDVLAQRVLGTLRMLGLLLTLAVASWLAGRVLWRSQAGTLRQRVPVPL